MWSSFPLARQATCEARLAAARVSVRMGSIEGEPADDVSLASQSQSSLGLVHILRCRL